MKLGRLLLWAALFGLTAGTIGCNDPYSRHRIAHRTERLHEQADGVVRQERHNADRLRDEPDVIRHWWKRDCEDFKERSAQVGDYVW